MLVHKYRFEKDHGRPPHIPELFDECHTKQETCQYITQKAKETREKYDQMVIEEYGDDQSTHPDFDERKWGEVIGPNHNGHRYGQGSVSQTWTSTGSEGSDMASGASSMLDLENRLVDRVVD